MHYCRSRIDYLFLQQEDLTHLLKVMIGTTTLSDHGPELISVESQLAKPAEWKWRLNESPRLDPALKGQVEKALTLYFDENDADDVTPLTLWEAHKSIIRGCLRGLATKKK
ncbi:Hypothetical predicted protein [Pelobates cultripes]|uniref:Endonuclease/exonuclease/phosphatase domain-containing protein n=1 Tax=Pelobates cultripes TaxID=61616 RepID=A0AAD1W8H5_PELCU|nr:Hypothetical predicted protein [Pelobates cultripes]